MPVERKDMGGEILLHRNENYENSGSSNKGRFNLGDIKDFIYEAEVNGATDDSCLFFNWTHGNGAVSSMLFKIENGVVPSPLPVVPWRKKPARVVMATSLIWILVILLFVSL